MRKGENKILKMNIIINIGLAREGEYITSFRRRGGIKRKSKIKDIYFPQGALPKPIPNTGIIFYICFIFTVYITEL